MKNIRFFKQDTVDELRAKIEKNLSWYREESDADAPANLDGYREMSKQVNPECWDQLNQNTAESDDIQNVITIYKDIDLSLQQAADERIWAYATHGVAGHYTAQRWNKIPGTGDDGNSDKAVKYILSHYFVSGVRGLIRDNAVARLWWMGYIASRCQDYDLEKTLDILLRDSDVRSNLLERSSVSMSKEIFSGVIRKLGRSLDNGDASVIYKRENFRALMKMLNRRGGRIMLNALGAQQIDDVLDDMAEKITSTNSNN